MNHKEDNKDTMEVQETKPQVEIESFTLDHDAVIAPYVRLIDTTSGPKGDTISNFDVRLSQPNEEFIWPADAQVCADWLYQ